MKHPTPSIAFLFLAGLPFFCACSNSSGNTPHASAAITSSSAEASASDLPLSGRDGRFSYTIDGKRIETVNNVQNANLFINEVSNDPASGLVKIEVTCSGSNVFDFRVTGSGTTTIDNYHPAASGKKATYMDGKTYRNLYAVSFTATVTSKDNSRISGTFSGTFKADQSDGGATATITSGSFNLPFIKN